MGNNMTSHITTQPNDVLPPTIVCVDDEEPVLRALGRVLGSLEVRIEMFSHPEAALAFLKANSASVIISDMRMPSISGSEFLAEALRLQPNAYRLLMTGYSDHTSTVAAVNDGHIQHYLAKPWENDELINAVKEGLAQHELIEASYRFQGAITQKNAALEREVAVRTRQLRKAMRKLQAECARTKEAYQGALHVLANTLTVNPIADGLFHQNVSALGSLLARRAELSDEQVEQIRLAGLLVHLGLLGIDPGILKKERSRLTVQEKNELSKHPQIAELILAPATHFNDLAQILAHQNEAYNGSGHPHGLIGDIIPIGSRILTIARDFWRVAGDVDAHFPTAYKKARHHLMQGMGIRYDPALVEVFCELSIDDIKRFETNDHAMTAESLEPGMILLEDLYNASGLLLLSKNSILTEESIAKLNDYQQVNDDILLINAELTPECGTTLHHTQVSNGG